MTALRTYGQHALAALLCLSMTVWSVMPTATHASTVFETIQDHFEMIADHGHSHGLEEDIYWAMHGHSHEAADHDHGQALLEFGDRSPPMFASSDAWRLDASSGGPLHVFRIERPPRA